MAIQMPSSSVKTRRVPMGAARSVYHTSMLSHRDVHDMRVKNFIEENELDERAAWALRGASRDLRDAVMRRGSLRDTRNPSAALLGRLRDASAILALSTSVRSWGAIQEERKAEIGVEIRTLKARDRGALKKRPPPPSTLAPQRSRNQMAVLRHRLSRLSRVVVRSIQRHRLAKTEVKHRPDPKAAAGKEGGQTSIGSCMVSAEWYATG